MVCDAWISGVSPCQLFQAAPYEQFFLFGDSITQESFKQERGFGFSAELQGGPSRLALDQRMSLTLAVDYIRRLDVVNRGFRYVHLPLLKIDG